MRVCNPPELETKDYHFPIHMRQRNVVGVGVGVGAGGGIHICLMYMQSGCLTELQVSLVNCCDVL
jgi:hypothetical protein